MEGPERINVGKILGSHGHLGAVRVEVFSDVPGRFAIGKVLHIGATPYRIAALTPSHSGKIVLKFQGLSNRAAAQALIGQWITVPATDVPVLPQGQYFHFQLLGLRVITEAREELGRITEILETGSNDVYLVSGEGGEILVPALSEVVREVGTSEGVMVVRLPQGLR